MAAPLELEIMWARAQALSVGSRVSEALELVEGQREYHGGESEYWIYFGLVLLANEKIQDAGAAARQSLELEPGTLAGIMLLTQCCYFAGDTERGLELARIMIEAAPNESHGHFWVAMILASTPRSRTQLEEAAAAITRALEIEPEDPDKHRVAAIIADLSGHSALALEHLKAGLAIAPNDKSLLLASGTIDGASTLVGERSTVLRSLLAVNPMDTEARGELEEVFLRRLQPLGRLPWLQGMLGALLVNLVFGWVGVIFAVLLVAAFGGYSVLKYQKAAAALPVGYDKDVLNANPLARNGLRLVAGSGALSVIGASVGMLLEDQRPGLLVISLGVVLGFAGGTLLDKAGSNPPPRNAPPAKHLSNMLIRTGIILSAHRVRFWMGAAGLLAFVVSLPDANYASAMIILIWGGWVLAVGVQIAYWSLRLGPNGNAWSRSKTLQSAEKRRGLALLSGSAQGVFYVALHVSTGLLAVNLGIASLAGPESVFDPPVTPDPQINQRYDPNIQVPLPTIPSMPAMPTLPSFPTLPAMPSINIPEN